MFEPLGKVGEVDESVVQEAYLFDKALGHYRGQRWEDAERLLGELASASPDTKLYKLYRERVFQFRYNPPEEQWNGVWVHTTK
jgi:adenylate cyclase